MTETRTQKNIVYRRNRRIDEVRVPYVVGMQPTHKARRKGFLRSLVALFMLAVTVSTLSLGRVGYTSAYFLDKDTSSSNSFLAGLLDFFVNVGDGDSIAVTITATSTASLFLL